MAFPSPQRILCVLVVAISVLSHHADTDSPQESQMADRQAETYGPPNVVPIISIQSVHRSPITDGNNFTLRFLKNVEHLRVHYKIPASFREYPFFEVEFAREGSGEPWVTSIEIHSNDSHPWIPVYFSSLEGENIVSEMRKLWIQKIPRAGESVDSSQQTTVKE
ncbi:hypothetical protein PoB_004831800 [Plakobranchus ocellatus]|uniref:Uncharacterized protein n=1 Tax=Plakobranchus ocellatus TaxID=259542 RepID=A0AAV4BRQ9_9GAST|nr:hypothetical protein PoB_004831800 [Plakobranchus ocellatus]